VSLLAVLLFQLDHWLAMLGTDALTTAYKSQMDMLGQPVTVTGENGDIRGVAMDVESDGALVLHGNDGDLKRVYAGDVTVKRSK
jgi:biotin-(acetyl-CoA carboxylase) ligase